MCPDQGSNPQPSTCRTAPKQPSPAARAARRSFSAVGPPLGEKDCPVHSAPSQGCSAPPWQLLRGALLPSPRALVKSGLPCIPSATALTLEVPPSACEALRQEYHPQLRVACSSSSERSRQSDLLSELSFEEWGIPECSVCARQRAKCHLDYLIKPSLQLRS